MGKRWFFFLVRGCRLAANIWCGSWPGKPYGFILFEWHLSLLLIYRESICHVSAPEILRLGRRDTLFVTAGGNASSGLNVALHIAKQRGCAFANCTVWSELVSVTAGELIPTIYCPLSQLSWFTTHPISVTNCDKKMLLFFFIFKNHI